MSRSRIAKRIVFVLLVLLVLGLLAAAVFLPSEATLARRLEQRFEQQTGVPLHIGRLHWQLLPHAMVALEDVATGGDQPPIAFRRLAGWPRLAPLLHGEIALERIVLDGASIPQRSLRQFQGVQPAGAGGTGPLRLAGLPLARAEFRDLQWIDRREIALGFEGEVDFDAGWRPRQARLERTNVATPARLLLQRQDQQDRWRAEVAIAQGSWNGELQLAEPAPGRWRITGELEPRGVELRALVETFKRRPVVTGRASGHTSLQAEGETPGELVRSLRTRTRFEAAPASILRFDLDRAIRTLGKEHAGNTALDSLSGLLETRSRPEGTVMHYRDLQARSGQLSASGELLLHNRQIEADVAVDLVQGVVGVPLRITGPVTSPSYSVPPAAIAGAAAGTAVLPGIGTVIGARIGDALGRLFGSGTAPAAGAPAGTADRRQQAGGTAGAGVGEGSGEAGRRPAAAPSGPPSTR